MPGLPGTNAKNNKIVEADRIVKFVCEWFDVTEGQMKCQSRRRYCLEPRQIAIYLVKRHTILSLNDIGGMFGNRDHTTIIHSINTVTDRMSVESAFRNIVNEIEGLI